MQIALNEAKKNLGNTSENPSVGCVITKDNSIIALGNTGSFGRPHAEINAFNFSKINLSNSVMYVTLEPCSHYGKTPPCINSIIKNKVKKVYFSIKDPDIRSFNKSKSILKSKKIVVQDSLLNFEVKKFYRSYIKSKLKNLPFVTCKIALSKDYFTIDKKKRWITNEFSRARVHLLRFSHDCIMTSSKTIISDNPLLNCRIPGLVKSSLPKMILDKNLNIPIKSNVVKSAKKNRTIIFYNRENKKKIKKLKDLKIKLYKISLNNSNKLNLVDILTKVKKMGFYRVFLESGAELTTNFLKNNLVDDLFVFTSNKNLGLNGNGSIKKYLKPFLKDKSFINEKVNLFGEKILLYKIK
jgi:diaminohydroxyphosphoribosylaminopyrimidine deaminase / 5-amino-6-(5-phosphoribosylamino)uracil reductase